MPTDALRGERPWLRRTPWLLFVLTLALVVRAWQPERLGLGHFDEGVYAISATGVVEWPDAHFFPGQTRFSPPAWFGGVGVVSRVLDVPPDRAAPWLNVLIGAMTAAIAGAVGMAWFGTVAGVAAGILLAVDPLSVMLSRSGLTDPLFTFWFLLALAAMVRALERGSWPLIGLAGVLTGLAWNTKYHGWFVGVIGGGAVTGLWWWTRAQAGAASRWRVAVGRLLAIGVVAGACYLPWALYMRQAAGSRGLGSFVDYYLTLIGTAWFTTAGRHLAMQAFLDAPLARVGLVGALAVALALSGGRLQPLRAAFTILGVVAIAALLGAFAVLVVLTGVGVLVLWPERARVPVAVTFAWLGLWVVAAPLYHPYARLLLPMSVVMTLLAGGGLAGLVRWVHAPDGRGASGTAAAAITMGLALLLWIVPGPGWAAGDPWRDGRGSEQVATAIAAVASDDAPIHVLGEPSIAHYLRRIGREAPTLADEFAVFDTITTPVYLAAGVYARRAPTLRAGIADLADRIDSLTAFSPDPTDLRLLDDLSPDDARRFRAQPGDEFDVVLYRIRPAAADRP